MGPFGALFFLPVMKLLSEKAAESLRGGALLEINVPIALNGAVGTQTSLATGVAVAALGSTATSGIGQFSLLGIGQIARSFAA